MGLTSILTLSCNDFATGLRVEVHPLTPVETSNRDVIPLSTNLLQSSDSLMTSPHQGRTYSGFTVTRIPAEIAEFNSIIWSVEP
jgi:hypothetical protein